MREFLIDVPMFTSVFVRAESEDDARKIFRSQRLDLNEVMLSGNSLISDDDRLEFRMSDIATIVIDETLDVHAL
jgi:hypothetical protein